MSLTIGETIQQLHRALCEYIEATYHVSHPILVAQRKQLLDELGVIHQKPYLESTPRYKTGTFVPRTWIRSRHNGSVFIGFQHSREPRYLDSRPTISASGPIS